MLYPVCVLQLIGTSTDLCEEIKIHTERTNYIKLHVCELDYILVIFCMNCLFHRIHVCQMTWRGKRNNLLWPLVVKYAVLLTGVMFERKQSIFIVSMLFRTDISRSTCVNLIYELPMHHTIYRNCTSFCGFWLKLLRQGFVKQNIKAHQHPLIKVSIIKTRLSTSMGNQGTVVTPTGRWPIIDSKNRVTVFRTKTSNLANHPRGLFSMEIIHCQANNYNTFLWWWMPALSFIIEQLKTKAPRQWNSLRTSY